jgi:hypothetical protein
MTAMEWAAIASLATAAGTLVLAVATFASVRSGNRSARAADRAARTAERSARIAERSLLAGQRPLLVNSRPQDPVQQVQFHEGKSLTVPGGGAELEVTDAAVYMAISVRNVGTGLAVMRGWHVGIGLREERSHPPLEEFTAQIRDIYVAPGDNGFWLGALRDPAAAEFARLEAEGLIRGDTHVDLTAEGAALHRSLREYIAGPTARLLGHFDIHDIETTVRTLQAITKLAAEESSAASGQSSSR